MKKQTKAILIITVITAICFFAVLLLYSQDNAGTAETEEITITEKTANPDKEKDEKKNETAERKDNADIAGQVEELRREVEELKKRLDESEKKIDTMRRLEISGFFDVYLSNYENKPNIFEIGNFELHFEHSYEYFQVAAALVFHEGAELSVAFIDYHLYGGRISPRGRLFTEKGVHLQIGKFDVPFGNDWQHFTSVNRISVSAPLTTDLIMDGGYNDVGGRLLLNFVSLYGTFFILRGIEEGYSYGGNSFGGRIGITPFSNPYSLKQGGIPTLDIGFSYIHDVNKAWESTEHIMAVDVESKINWFFIQSEYYRRNKLVGIRFNGFQVTTGIDLLYINNIPLSFFLRYDLYHMKRYKVADEENYLTRITGGFNLNIARISYLKFEYQRYLTTYAEYTSTEYYSENLFYLQFIISF